jgi:carboxymethylenebutenolidase
MPAIQLPYFLSLPAARPPFAGVLVIHEGMGISAQLLRLAERLTAEGYAVCAPDFFFRSGGPEATDFTELIGSITPEQLESDLATGVGYLRDVGASPIGVTGFCMGGWFTYRAALWAKDLGVQAAVPFYGGGIAREIADPACPTLLFFGGRDAYIPTADIEAVQQHHGNDVVVYPDAEHGFMRDGSPNYDEASATDAWKRMLGFFGEHLS